ncbi:MAG: hypothetical protein RL385_2360 [Pseudomonadota bacterium]|jgi:hypothetical protein
MLNFLSRMRFAVWATVAILAASAQPVRADVDICAAAHERAQLARLSGQLLLSRENARQCAQPTCHVLIQTDCTRWLGEINAELPSVAFSARSVHGETVSDIRVYIQGVLVGQPWDMREVPLDPGHHEVRFEAPGFAPVVVALTLHRAEARHVVQAVLTPLSENRAPIRTRDQHASAGPSSAPASARRRRLYVAAATMGGLAAASLATYQLLRWRAQTAADAGDDARLGALRHAGWGVAGLGTAAALASAVTLSWALWGIDEAGAASRPDANATRVWVGFHGKY